MRVFFDSIGCRLNHSEIEGMAAQLCALGHQVVADASHADVTIINTCAVTAAASSDSRQKVRQAARAGANRIYLTGCYATVAYQNAATLPGVVGVIPNSDKETLIWDLLDIKAPPPDLQLPPREPLPGAHKRTRAFIKVQDGCDNFCTYCITRIARGSSRSHTKEEILRDVLAAEAGGVQEIVLTGAHLGSWGRDLAGGLTLPDLAVFLLEHTSIPRVRLSSLEPWDIDERFFCLLALPRFCRHLHLPLQSGCQATLQRMARNTTTREFEQLIEAIRAQAPSIAITTDVMVGFPAEDEQEFTESRDFIERMQFAGGHVFSYSARPGTPAAQMAGQVPAQVRKERSAEMRALLQRAQRAYQDAFIDQQVAVLWEKSAGEQDGSWRLEGLSDNYLRVQSSATQNLWNRISWVKLTDIKQNCLQGVIAS